MLKIVYKSPWNTEVEVPDWSLFREGMEIRRCHLNQVLEASCKFSRQTERGEAKGVAWVKAAKSEPVARSHHQVGLPEAWGTYSQKLDSKP